LTDQKILLVDHGSRATEANQSTEALADQLAKQLGADVATVHMEIATPLLADVLAVLKKHYSPLKLIVVPLFITKGNHYDLDIQEPLKALAQANSNISIYLLPPLAHQEPFLRYLQALLIAANEATRIN